MNLSKRARAAWTSWRRIDWRVVLRIAWTDWSFRGYTVALAVLLGSLAAVVHLNAIRVEAQTAGGDVQAQILSQGGWCLEEVAKAETGSTYAPHIASQNGVYVGLFQFDELTWESTSVGQSGVLRSAATVSEQIAAAAELLMGGLGRQSWPNTLPAGCG